MAGLLAGHKVVNNFVSNKTNKEPIKVRIYIEPFSSKITHEIEVRKACPGPHVHSNMRKRSTKCRC